MIRIAVVGVAAMACLASSSSQKPPPNDFHETWCIASMEFGNIGVCTRGQQACHETRSRLSQEVQAATSACYRVINPACFEELGGTERCFPTIDACHYTRQRERTSANSCSGGEPAAVADSGAPFYCSRSEDDLGVCRPSVEACNLNRQEMAALGHEIGKCEPAARVACFIAVSRLNKGAAESCYPDFRSCETFRTALVEKYGADFESASECEARE